jgi:hypothetical protein
MLRHPPGGCTSGITPRLLVLGLALQGQHSRGPAAGPVQRPDVEVGTDDPGAVLPNGHILISLSPLGMLDANGSYNFPSPTYIYEYDPVAQTFTDTSAPGLGGVNAFQLQDGKP